MKIRPYFKHRGYKYNTSGISYTPKQLATFYGFPSAFTGAGKKVAVIELGGGYIQSDLDGYFKDLGLVVKPVVFHSVQGATNSPGDPSGADGEVMLDLCVIGAMAPGAELHCYMAPNTDSGFLSAVVQATSDKMDAISISWGGPEDQWSSTSMSQFNAAFKAAGDAGITVTAAAGDNGSGDGEAGQHVDFPASSPYVLGCGGTSLQSMSPIVENVWNDGSVGGATGGGLSSLFALPAWQSKANIPGGTKRGVPDVAGNADPYTGWSIILGGQQVVIGGTSAVAPMWAALAVVLSQALGKNVGFLNPMLYSLTGWNRDIVSGNNGTYLARPGYDDCTGMGVPVGTALLAALKPVAPIPAPIPPPVQSPPAPAPTPPPRPPPGPTPTPVPVPPPHPTPAPPPVKQHTIVITGATHITVDGKVII